MWALSMSIFKKIHICITAYTCLVPVEKAWLPLELNFHMVLSFHAGA